MRYFVILLVFIAACDSSPAQQVEKIDTERFTELLKQPDVQLVDVRTEGEVSQGYIEGAQHIDFYDPEFKEKIQKLDKEKPIVVYCAVGGRSGQATHVLKDLGFEQIYDLQGGYTGWAKDGLPTVKE